VAPAAAAAAPPAAGEATVGLLAFVDDACGMEVNMDWDW
jgi:hypothetical protein